MPAKNGKAKLANYRTQRRNANKHTQRGLGMLANSIGKDGWIGALTVAADGETFDGSARLEVLADAMPDAEPIVVETDGHRPVIVRRTDIPNTDDPRAKRLGVAANRVQQVDYDPDADILREISGEIDLGDWWREDELAELLGEDGRGDADAEPQFDRAEELRIKWGVELGQLWRIGEHRLLCGDCMVRENVERVLGEERPHLCVTDPPYGVNYDAQWRSDAAKEGHLAYAASRVGQVVNDDRSDWREAWALFPGDVIYSWHPRGATSLVPAGALQDSGFVIRIQIIWAKSNFPIGRGDYHVRHEPCWYAVRKGKPSLRTDDRTQTTLWEINLDKNVEGGHSTQKPLECMARPIRNHSGDVYDPFLGSGTTMVAAQNLDRRCFALEISPGYVGVCLERMSQAFPDIEIVQI